MTNRYVWVQWNAHKKAYDILLLAGVALFLLAFVGLGLALFPPPNEIAAPVLLMRALGVGAITLLHIVLAIGPLARLSPRFTPLLYNRRHMGVTVFALAGLHGFLAVGFYGGFGEQNPLTAVLAGYASFDSVAGFPFEILGFAALAVLFVMAATSHDFWLKNLGATLWKWLHMLVYPAYALIVAHVLLGAIQSEVDPLYPVLLGAGALTLVTLHLAAGLREAKRGAASGAPSGAPGEWIDLGDPADIPETRAKVVRLKNADPVAVFRDGDTLHALSGVCAHQGGPLAEGQILDGCVTCPWHGYQYRPNDGCSPPPYEEKLPTYELRLEGDRLLLNPTPNAPGTPTAPVRAPRGGDDHA